MQTHLFRRRALLRAMAMAPVAAALPAAA
ncbi:MAG: hypothetical protein JWP29_1772, partial [Rhodoferax sp.]|nr:hypothetical protein [Rhodoferax sp.]